MAQKIENSTDLISLPFFAPEHTLPADLPTVATIEASCEVLKERLATKIVAIGQHFVVKYGAGVSLEEGRTMLYLKEHTACPVPIVYAVFHESEQNYIIMQRTYGRTLEQAWPSLSAIQKHEIVQQLKSYFGEIRKLPSPGAFCSLDNGPLRDDLFWMKLRDGTFGYAGPFNSEIELVGSLVQKCRSSEAIAGKASFYEYHLPTIFRKQSPTFTHGDLQQKNIMVRVDGLSKPEVVILDWESAGWYPSCWEYAQAISACGFFDDDWHEWVNEILVPCPKEYAWIYMLLADIG